MQCSHSLVGSFRLPPHSLPSPTLALLSSPLSATALDNTQVPGDSFGSEDKLVPCNGKLVFVDLDNQERYNSPQKILTLNKCGYSAASLSTQQWIMNGTTNAHIALYNAPSYL
jgi:hypothetical protein